MKTLVAVLSLLLILGIAGSAWAQGDVAKGKALVEAKHCALCHKEGGNLGKPVEMIVGTNTDAYLKGALTDPKKTLGPQVKMPELKLTDAEVQDVIAYLHSIAKH
jgi:cytochrome c553